jgi:hypothetical protein
VKEEGERFKVLRRRIIINREKGKMGGKNYYRIDIGGSKRKG